LLCFGKATEEELELFGIVIYLIFWKEIFQFLGKSIDWQGMEITEGAFSGGIFLMRSIHLRRAVEQIMENGYIEKGREKKNENEDGWSQ